MDGVLDERQKQRDAGIVFRAVNFAHAGRENRSSLARALYCASPSVRKRIGEYRSVSSQGSSKEGLRRCTFCGRALRVHGRD